MSLLNLTVKHGRTLEEARAQLEASVNEVRSRFGPMVQRVEWSADRSAVTLAGAGLRADLRVDAQELHAAVDLPLLVGLASGPLLAGLKGILQQRFEKRLPR